jgi:hypothetical protein
MSLKQRGAKVTRHLAEDICERRLPLSIHRTFTLAVFLKPEYYKPKAQRVMREGYPGWGEGRLQRSRRFLSRCFGGNGNAVELKETSND